MHGSRAQVYHDTEYQALQIPESEQHDITTHREHQTQGHYAYTCSHTGKVRPSLSHPDAHTRQGCEETSFQTMKFGRDGGGASFGNHCQLKQYADIILGVVSSMQGQG